MLGVSLICLRFIWVGLLDSRGTCLGLGARDGHHYDQCYGGHEQGHADLLHGLVGWLLLLFDFVDFASNHLAHFEFF